jgi:hypothetical protein
MVNQLRGIVFSIAALFVMAGASLPARAEVGFHFSPVITGVLPANTNLTYQGIAVTATGKLGLGYGALVGTRFSPYWGIETGTIYVQRNYTETGEFLGTQFSLDVNTKAFHFPLGIRIYLGNLLSLEAGGYFESSPDSDSESGTNYGVQGGLRFSLPLSKSAALFAEARYNQGLKDYGGYKTSDLVFALVGVTFGTLSK